MQKCGVIGVGYIGKFHAEKFAKLPDTELVGVADNDKVRAQKIAGELQTQAFTDYHELVKHVDAVSVAAPTRFHYDIAKYCLEHGVHVLVEKPMTRTVDEAKELIELANTNKLILQIGHLERFNAVNMAVRDILKAPLFIQSKRLSPFTPRGTDVSVVLDLMIHDIDLIQNMVQSEILTIDASGTPILSDDVDIANARIKFANGCVADITASRVSLNSERSIKLFQHDAFIDINLQNHKLSIHRIGEEEMFPGIPEITLEEQTFSQSDAIKAEIEAFIGSIVHDKPSVVPGEDGLKALETAIEITRLLNEHMDFVKKVHPYFTKMGESIQ